MKWLQRIFDFYLNSSIHVSLAVVSLAWLSCLQLNIIVDDALLWFVFFATITGYNFIKYSRLAKLHHLSLTESLRAIQIFSLFCFIAMVYMLLWLSIEVVIACIVFGIPTLLYALPVFSRKRNLRSLYGLKMYSIAFVWAGVTVILPVVHDLSSLHWDVWIVFIQRFLFVIVITLPFDIRDLRYDAEAIETIPKKLGVRRSKFLGVVLGALFFILEFLKDELQIGQLLSIGCICVLCGFAVLAASEKQPKYYASFFVEGVPILWLGLFLFINNLLP